MKLSSELSEFQSTIRKFFEKEAPLSYVRRRFEEERSSDPDLRKKLEALSLFEFFKDSGGTIRELSVLAKETGRALFPETIIDELLGAMLIGDDFASNGIICLGEAIDTRNSVLCRGSIEAESVLFQRGEEVLVASRKDKSVSVSKKKALDRTLPLLMLGIGEGNFKRIGSCEKFPLKSYLSILRAAEVAGALEAVVAITKEYVKTRRQFDVPIGGFQAVQHSMANMLLVSQSLSALVDFAAWASIESPTQRDLSAVSALSYACEKGPEVVEAAVQLHGGIGFTWEYDLHFYLRRVRSIAALHGGIEDHAAEILDAAGQ